MAEPQTRGLTTQEIALLTSGLDALQRPDAGALAQELINATAIAVVQRQSARPLFRVQPPAPHEWSEQELAELRRQS